MRLFRPAETVTDGTDPVLIDPVDAGWEYAGLRVLRLTAGVSRTVALGDLEAAVVPLSAVTVTVETDDGHRFELKGRYDVFSAIPDLCFIPRDTEFRLTSATGGEVAVATAYARRRTKAFYRPAEEVEVQVRGAGRATRQITQLLGADVHGPDRLIVVEVHTPEGNWSSYPPHKHDEWSEDEVPLEEIYYFRIRGEAGFGMHRTYTTDGDIDETVTVRDGDVFLVPRGFHGPCVAAPGYDMYYLNVMAGPADEREWRICTDPHHAWLWEAWQGVAQDPRVPMTAA